MAETELEILVRVIANKTQIPIERLGATTPLADLAIASLDMVEILFELEDILGVDIPFNANEPADLEITLSALADRLKEQVKRIPQTAP